MKVEIFTTKTKPLPYRKFPGFKQEGPNLWAAYMPEKNAKKYLRLANKYGLKARMYDEKYERSPKYRYEFIKANPPVNGYYQCVYCGRFIKKDDMEVDHIFPVTKAKTSKRIQKRLKHGVNSLSNLVPSCHRCNKKKLDSTSFRWRVKAMLGKHKAFWIIKYLFLLAIVIFVLLLIWKKNPALIVRASKIYFETFLRRVEKFFWPIRIFFNNGR